MSHLRMRAALCASIALLCLPAAAHEIVGNRFFPATLTVDDPGVNDELALPTVSTMRVPNDDGTAVYRQTNISAEYAKRITEDFAIAVSPNWAHFGAPGGPMMTGASGLQNLETSFKYRLYANPEHEFVFSVGLEVEWGHTGSASVGAESFTTVSPTIYVGKGFGDLPTSLNWVRPFAVTGQVGYAIPTRSSLTTIGDDGLDIEFNPRVLEWGGSLQYSLPYLKSNVKDFGWPDLINGLIPLVEFTMETPVSNTFTSGTKTTGTVNPGVIWAGRQMQFGVEALIPVNPQSGRGVGFIAQVHWYLDDIFPNSIGKPLFANTIASGRPKFGN